MATRVKKDNANKIKQDVPVYAVYGKNRRAVIDKMHEITAVVLQGADLQMALDEVEGPRAVLADVLDGLRTAAFLAPRRLVIVKQADDFISRYRKQLEDYLDKPADTGVLLLIADSFPGNTRLAKKVAKIGQVFACEQVKPRDLPRYLTNYAANNFGLKLDYNAARLLMELGGDDSALLICELEKIAAYMAVPAQGNAANNTNNRQTAGQASKHSALITTDVIELLVGNNRSYNVFAVIDAMTAGKPKDALERLDKMLSQDKQAEFKSVGAFAWYFRRLYQARLLMDDKTPDRVIIQKMRIWSQPNEFIKQVRKLKITEIARLLAQLADIDYASKTGRGTVRDGLEKFIVSTAN